MVPYLAMFAIRRHSKSCRFELVWPLLTLVTYSSFRLSISDHRRLSGVIGMPVPPNAAAIVSISAFRIHADEVNRVN